jgi:AraC-like DNA-binding protein
MVGWDLDHRQLDAGKFIGSLDVVACSDVIVQRVNFSRRIHQQGCAPKGILTFGLPMDVWSTNWNGRNVEGDYILFNFNRRDGFDGVSEVGFDAETLSLTDGAFQRAAVALDVDIQAEQIPDCADSFSIEKSDYHNIKQASARLFEFASVGSATNRITNTELQDEFAQAIVAAIAKTLPTHCECNYPKRQQAVNRALEIIDSTNNAISIRDLFEDSACSWRTINRGFRERFGVTPKQYILATRMSSVRKEILASPPQRRITDIANNWGFWHLGRFSTEYKKLFGELPSATARS